MHIRQSGRCCDERYKKKESLTELKLTKPLDNPLCQINRSTLITNSTVEKIVKEYPYCFKCNGPAEEIHHVWGRDKQFKKYFDLPENLIRLCTNCNGINKGSVENPAFRQKVWSHKLSLGYDMDGWVRLIPMLIKDRFPNYAKERNKHDN